MFFLFITYIFLTGLSCVHEGRCYTAIRCFYSSTHSNDVSLYRQQIKECEELNSEDGINLCGRQHQHSQGEQHLGITLEIPLLCCSVRKVHTHTHN